MCKHFRSKKGWLKSWSSSDLVVVAVLMINVALIEIKLKLAIIKGDPSS